MEAFLVFFAHVFFFFFASHLLCVLSAVGVFRRGDDLGASHGLGVHQPTPACALVCVCVRVTVDNLFARRVDARIGGFLGPKGDVPP